MSKTKGGGSTKNGRDSNAQRLGVKAFDGTRITAGTIIVRQRGTRVHPGKNVRRASDDSLFSLVDGSVQRLARFEARGHAGAINLGQNVARHPEGKVSILCAVETRTAGRCTHQGNQIVHGPETVETGSKII